MLEIKSEQFDSEILKAGKVIVDFYSTECPPCEAVAPKFEGLAELYGSDVKFLKIFRQQNRELADKLEIKSSPTLLFFDNGKEVATRLSGAIKRKDIIENLNSMISEDRAKDIASKIKPSVTEFDVVILGGGPAGLAAGLYLSQAKVNTAIIDMALPGGQVSTTHQVSNYPGFIEPQPGYMLSHYMSEQTKHWGTTYKVAVDVTKIDLDKKEIVIDEFETVKAKKIIIATGTSPNTTNAPGEKEFKGKGISYCATCDAKYFVDKDVLVIGGGNSAVEEAEFITRFAKKVTLVHQFDALTANKTAQEKLLANQKVNVLFSHEPRSFDYKDGKMITIVEDLKTKEKKELVYDGVFVFIGMKPNIDLFKDKLELDKWGYVKTNEDMQTSMSDIYAIGDVISKKYRQITTAVADGTIAAIAIAKEL